MRHNTCANHVQINVDQTLEEVIAALDGRRVIAVFPKCTVPFFSLIVLLSGASGQVAHCGRNGASVATFEQKVNMIARDDVVEDASIVPSSGLEQSQTPEFPIPSKLQKKITIVASVSDVP